MVSFASISILMISEFRNLMLGRLFIVMAFRMLSTLLGWWVYELTKDPFAIGLIGLSEVIPAVITALYAGLIIDKSEKKKLLLICNYAYFLLISVLAIMAYFQYKTSFFNRYTLTYFIYSIVFLTGICRAFLGPLIPTMIPKIVGKENLVSAISINQGVFLIASVLGHALGGFFIHWFGIENTLLIVIYFILLSSIFFWCIKNHPLEYQNNSIKVLESIRVGINYILKTKEILGALLLDMFAVLFGGVVALIPVFASDILKVGSKGLGLLNAATDIGSVLVIIYLSFFPLHKNQGKILIFSVVGFGICIIGFGLSKIYWLSFILLLLSGVLDGISVVIRGTIVQLKTPDEIRGRVLSVNSIFIMSSNELGQFESGIAAKLFGVVRSVILGGCATVFIASFIGFNNKNLREMSYK